MKTYIHKTPGSVALNCFVSLYDDDGCYMVVNSWSGTLSNDDISSKISLPFESEGPTLRGRFSIHARHGAR